MINSLYKELNEKRQQLINDANNQALITDIADLKKFIREYKSDTDGWYNWS